MNDSLTRDNYLQAQTKLTIEKTVLLNTNHTVTNKILLGNKFSFVYGTLDESGIKTDRIHITCCLSVPECERVELPGVFQTFFLYFCCLKVKYG